jgi:transcriptional regulator with XRE-family HTH domain
VFVTKTTLAERLEKVLEHLDITAYELSIRAGLSGSHIANIIKRNAKRTSAETIQLIARAAGVSERWLSFGEGSMHDESSTPEASDVPPRTAQPDTVSAAPNYAALKKTARKLAPEVTDEWVWNDLDGTNLLWIGLKEPTPQVLADIARLLMKHGQPK